MLITRDTRRGPKEYGPCTAESIAAAIKAAQDEREMNGLARELGPDGKAIVVRVMASVRTIQ